ncbi:DEAD/DEAH box helicase [Nocardia crassostreae]|uniref:DEAD/DEAH box helicase n=1 Tax=Nocardia crassostreae TaxID=53428 RepID=UPI000B1EEFC1|nr:DEAD/DEAH box helicase [Nocardia crassostreae]
MTTRSSSPALSFSALGVRKPIVDALAAKGITAPKPIQAATLPDVLAGHYVLGRGRTGSGKTLAFSIPLVERLAGGNRTPGRPAGLILAPTRELVTQIAAALEPMTAACGLKVTTVFGGVPQNRQAKALQAGVDIVVACPGRLEDLMQQRLVSLDAVRITVLDEADHMADLGFLPGVTRILAATPADGQRLLFSATLDNGVNKLVQRFMRNPLSHKVDEAHSPVPDMTHHVFEVTGPDAKRELVTALAWGTGRRILFMRTKHHARRLAKQLTAVGIPATDLHSNLSQAARDRNLAAFADGTARVLVATDVAARGVHVDDVQLVVHVDPPAEHKAYLHRSGRTARAGSSGDVVTLVLPDQRKDVAVLLKKAGIAVEPQRVTAHSAPVTALVGPIAPPTTPAATNSEAREQQTARPGRRGNGQARTGNAPRAGGSTRGANDGGSRGAGNGSSRNTTGSGTRRTGGGGSRGTSGGVRGTTGTSTRDASEGSRGAGGGSRRGTGNGGPRRATSEEFRGTGSGAAARRGHTDSARSTGGRATNRREDRPATGSATRSASSGSTRAHAGTSRRRSGGPAAVHGERSATPSQGRR